MARPADPLLVRLRNQVWARALRSRALELSVAEAVSWAELERGLMATVCPEAAVGRVQSLLRVVHDGNDPRRVVRRIDIEQLPSLLPDSASVSERVPGSRHPEDSLGAKKYQSIEVDLVVAGEKLVPGSAAWMTSPFWWLAAQELPALEDVRRLIAPLKAELGLLTAVIPVADSRHAAQTPQGVARRDRALRYEQSLQLITKNPSAVALSLMAALLVESYLADQEILHDMHLSAFEQMVETMLSQPLFGDIREPFESMVTSRFLMRPWVLPDEHRSSVDAPFLTEAQLSQELSALGQGWIARDQNKDAASDQNEDTGEG